MTTMRHRMQEALNRLPVIDPIKLHVGVSDRTSDAMMLGAREALRYFLLGTTDAPPELLKALQGTTDDFWSAEKRARLERVADASAPPDIPAAPQHAEIWYLWAGKLTELQPTGGRYVVGAGLAPTDTDTMLRMQIHAVLAAAAIAFEDDLPAIRREGGRGVDRATRGQRPDGARADIRQREIGVAGVLDAHRELRAVG